MSQPASRQDRSRQKDGREVSSPSKIGRERSRKKAEEVGGDDSPSKKPEGKRKSIDVDENGSPSKLPLKDKKPSKEKRERDKSMRDVDPQIIKTAA